MTKLISLAPRYLRVFWPVKRMKTCLEQWVHRVFQFYERYVRKNNAARKRRTTQCDTTKLIGWLVGWRVGWLNWFNAELCTKRYWRRPRSQEAGDEGGFTYRFTVTTRMTRALRWAAMRAILMFQPFWRERRAEAVSNRSPSAYQPNALPLGQTGSQTVCAEVKDPSVENPELTNVLPFKPGTD